ncbi:unnamed protein product [Sphenostylis stenocarpa]|uniref:Uncharacterized protein n=1 Tax=Sphenostylis stenocarpa TaxID=92480 RepID=A0AA86RTM7_9FABA|nr:unnamed protein product [Sphenostylis stenocarpa]
MVKLVDTLLLGSSARASRFESEDPLGPLSLAIANLLHIISNGLERSLRKVFEEMKRDLSD